MNFYLDCDLRQGRIFIAPTLQKVPLYLIEVAHRGEGDRLLRDLNFGRMNGPLRSPELYELVETVEEQLGKLKGTIMIYKLKG